MDTTEVLSVLRNEIVESQKTQAEFLKWKLIAVGAVASISLGLAPSSSPGGNVSATASDRGQELLLCAIPLICAYVDFVSLHIMIRIVTIGAYLRRVGSHYERFVFLTRERGANPFIFETAALHGSSFVFNLVLIGLSFADIAVPWIQKAYLLGGVLGLVVAAFSWMLYTLRARRVSDLAAALDIASG